MTIFYILRNSRSAWDQVRTEVSSMMILIYAFSLLEAHSYLKETLHPSTLPSPSLLLKLDLVHRLPCSASFSPFFLPALFPSVAFVPSSNSFKSPSSSALLMPILHRVQSRSYILSLDTWERTSCDHASLLCIPIPGGFKDMRPDGITTYTTCRHLHPERTDRSVRV